MRADISKLCNGIAVVSHDANQTGAPYIALNIARELKIRRGIPVITILLRSGPLAQKFAELGPVFVAPARPRSFRSDPRLWARVVKSAIWGWQNMIIAIFWTRVGMLLRKRRFLGAFCNSVLSGEAAVQLSRRQVRCIGLVHEMPLSIQVYDWTAEARALINGAAALVFPSPRVQAAFTRTFPSGHKRQLVAPQSFNIDLKHLEESSYVANRAVARKRLQVSEGDIVILGCGQGGYRKGIDLFFEVARQICLSSATEKNRIVFVWVGAIAQEIQFWLERDIAELQLSERIIFAGEQVDAAPYFAAADIFFLPSREDPFPTVVLEAMVHGVPVVGFANTGGLEDQIEGGAGIAVPFGDVAAAASAMRDLADQPHKRAVMGRLGREKIARSGGIAAYVDRLVELWMEFGVAKLTATRCGFLTESSHRPN